MEIQIQNVSFTYPKGREVLSNLTLDLPASGLTGLLGPNGAGKSHVNEAFVRLPSALLRGHPGQRPTFDSGRAVFEGHLGYLPQGFGLFEELTPAQFLNIWRP